MPVVAVVAAIATDAFAISSGAALLSLTGIAAIGATTAAIGAVTGNKTLEMIGGGLGIVGAVGTLATSAGLFGADASSTTSIFGSSASAAGTDSLGVAGGVADGTGVDSLGVAGGAAPDAAGVAGGAAGEGAGIGAVSSTGAIGPDAFNQAGIINSALAAPEGDTAALEGANNTAGAATVLPQGTAPTGGVPSGGMAGASSSAAPGASGAADATPPGTSSYNDAVLSNGSVLGGTMTGAPLSSASGGILNWAKNNQLLSYGIIQAGGSFISGLTNPLTPAQISALNSQAAANNAAATLTNKQVANMGQSMPTASTGMINNKPVNTPLITGAPNTGTPATPTQVTGVPA